MRRSLAPVIGAALLAAAASAQDHPNAPEAADHVLQVPADPAAAPPAEAHAHDDMLKPRVPTLLTGYGVGGFTITTAVPEAQAFFSNGMELGAAFAHSAAGAAMEHAVELDPACAMCKWGQALVEGPTINYGKDADERKPLYALARAAEVEAIHSGTAKERELTAALVERYRPRGTTNRRDTAYAAAMTKLQRRQTPALKLGPNEKNILRVTLKVRTSPCASTTRKSPASAARRPTSPATSGWSPHRHRPRSTPGR